MAGPVVSNEELAAMREAQDRHMPDEVRIERRSPGSYNPETFKHDHNTVVLYEGPCDFMLALFSNISAMRGNPVIVEMALRTERLWMLFLPYEIQDVKEGDYAVILSARDEWAPREVVVALVQGGGFATRRLLACKELE